MKTLRLAAVLTAAGIALAACGGDGGDGSPAPTPAATSAAESAASGDARAGGRIEIENFEYLPTSLEAGPGTEITVTNTDTFAHTVTSGEPRSTTGTFDEDLGDIGEMNGRGAEVTITVPDEPGTYAYFCRFHPSMRGEIVVSG